MRPSSRDVICAVAAVCGLSGPLSSCTGTGRVELDGAPAGVPDGICGDAVVDANELCDDGADNGKVSSEQAHCTRDCMGTQLCGNGAVEGNETCDEGEANGTISTTTPHCTPTCTGKQLCGNGYADGTETCDDGGRNGTISTLFTYCTATCDGTQLCGNDTPEGSEVCDQGADNGTISTTTAFCTPLCGGTQLCGNDIPEGSEACDQGLANGTVSTTTAYCTPTCDGTQLCGNWQREGSEVCDDGDALGEGMCLDDCSGIQLCGDGELRGTEACDDGNTDPLDGCSATCVPECPCPAGTLASSARACDLSQGFIRGEGAIVGYCAADTSCMTTYCELATACPCGAELDAQTAVCLAETAACPAVVHAIFLEFRSDSTGTYRYDTLSTLVTSALSDTTGDRVQLDVAATAVLPFPPESPTHYYPDVLTLYPNVLEEDLPRLWYYHFGAAVLGPDIDAAIATLGIDLSQYDLVVVLTDAQFEGMAYCQFTATPPFIAIEAMSLGNWGSGLPSYARDEGTDVFLTDEFLHEIGHMMGLLHACEGKYNVTDYDTCVSKGDVMDLWRTRPMSLYDTYNAYGACTLQYILDWFLPGYLSGLPVQMQPAPCP